MCRGRKKICFIFMNTSRIYFSYSLQPRELLGRRCYTRFLSTWVCYLEIWCYLFAGRTWHVMFRYSLDFFNSHFYKKIVYVLLYNQFPLQLLFIPYRSVYSRVLNSNFRKAIVKYVALQYCFWTRPFLFLLNCFISKIII